MVVEQKAKKTRNPKVAKKIQIIKDMDFSVVTHDGLMISCKPSENPNKLYCVFSNVESQAYFGITQDALEKRERSRMREVADGEMRAIHVAIRNQGFENFVMFEVACFESIDEAAAAEKLHILNYKTYNAVGGCGYNSSPGGQTGGGSYSEAEGKTRVNESIDFYFKNNRWPRKDGADEYEKSLGSALNNLRSARNNLNSDHKFYASYQSIADERGVPHMFFSDEERGQRRVKESIDFYYARNKKWPYWRSADEYEKSLGIALNNLRTARNNPEGDRKFYASYQTIADERGVPEMFLSGEEYGQRRVKEMIDFYYAHNKTWPNKSSADEYEKSLGIALSNLRSARKNPEDTSCKFYASYQTIADERGVSKMFFSLEELKNWEIEEFAQFIKDNGRPPKSNIKEERTLYKWMDNRKRDIRSGKPKRWTPSNNETAIRFDVFRIIN